MSAEERWAQGREWERERGEVEIKLRRLAPENEACAWKGCAHLAIETVRVGRVAGHGGMGFSVCPDHADADSVFTIYERLNR